MIDIYTAQYRYGGVDRLDVTVKGQHPLGKIFAPTWQMVMDSKKGKLSDVDYTWNYLAILEGARKKPEFGATLQFGRDLGSLTLVCFCPPGNFCHRTVLANWLAAYGGMNNIEINFKGERDV